MSGYTTIALAVGGAVMSAAGSYHQQQTANANIAMQNAINRNKAIAAQNSSARLLLGKPSRRLKT